jgi:hypothetical protein
VELLPVALVTKTQQGLAQIINVAHGYLRQRSGERAG